MKNTIALNDANLSGKVVWQTEDTVEETAEYFHERAGLWTRFEGGDGDILLSESWNVDFYEGQELTEDDVMSGYTKPTYLIQESADGDRADIQEY